MKQYEAMFIFDPTFATEFRKVEAEVQRIMERAGAEIVVSRKWEERKLAFEMKRRKRGCFVLTYFRAAPESIVGIERDCALSEHILRVLVVCAEGISRQRIEAWYPERAVAAPSAPAEKPPADVGPSVPKQPGAPDSKDSVELVKAAAVATAQKDEIGSDSPTPPPADAIGGGDQAAGENQSQEAD